MEEKKSIIKKYTESKNNQTEKVWIYAFNGIGLIMFVAAIWEPLVTMFYIDKEVVPMSKYQVTFASVGFVLALGGSFLGTIANNIGAILSEKLKNIF